MSWLFGGIDKAVQRGVAKAVDREFAPGGIIARAVDDALGVNLPDNAPMTETQFVMAMCQRFAKAGVKTTDECRTLAWRTLGVFLADEKIPFGHPDYSWDRSGARELVEEIELQHWETVA